MSQGSGVVVPVSLYFVRCRARTQASKVFFEDSNSTSFLSFVFWVPGGLEMRPLSLGTTPLFFSQRFFFSHADCLRSVPEVIVCPRVHFRRKSSISLDYAGARNIVTSARICLL